MKAGEIIRLMEDWARKDLIDSWDNTGFQVGHIEKSVNSILIALDLDRFILDLAIKEDFDMIITHHPLIFKSLTSITSESYKERLIMDIIKNDIVVYNAHSNLDLADNGVNDQLSNVFQLKDSKILSEVVKVSEDEKLYGYGRIGDIEEITVEELILKVKEKLNVENLVVHGNTNKIVKSLALCGGSGSDFIYDAYKLGADVYITGDVKYHEAQHAHELGLTLIDPGHFHTEKVILPAIKEYLDIVTGKDLRIEVIMETGLPQRIY